MEHRQARRIILNVPVVVRVIGMPEVRLHPALERVYERVTPNPEATGATYPGVIRDISENGAFIAGEPLPLLSRVELVFELPSVGQVDAVGWVLWRRTDTCEMPAEDDQVVTLPKGFGMLFEAIPLEARIAIHKLVNA